MGGDKGGLLLELWVEDESIVCGFILVVVSLEVVWKSDSIPKGRLSYQWRIYWR